MSQVVSLAFHPRDIGTLLIGYTDGAVLFSFQLNAPTKFFRYELPAGAPGGDLEPSRGNAIRYPRLTQALWHPTGTFILTVHEDSSFVLWDPTPKEGRKILARTLQASHVDQPGAASSVSGSSKGTFAIAEPLFKVAWCCKENPDDTGILVAGGSPSNNPAKGLTFLDLGPTPVYATSSYQVLEQHFAKPKRQHLLPTPPNAEVVDFLPHSSEKSTLCGRLRSRRCHRSACFWGNGHFELSFWPSHNTDESTTRISQLHPSFRQSH